MLYKAHDEYPTSVISILWLKEGRYINVFQEVKMVFGTERDITYLTFCVAFENNKPK